MSRIKFLNLDFNPHIRGIKTSKSHQRLSNKAKSIYELLNNKLADVLPKENRNVYSVQRFNKIRFTPVETTPFSKPKRTLSENKFQKVLKSPVKEISKKKNLSPDEKREIENLISSKLETTFSSIRQKVEKKIKKLSIHNIFNEEINTLRTESVAAVELKKV